MRQEAGRASESMLMNRLALWATGARSHPLKDGVEHTSELSKGEEVRGFIHQLQPPHQLQLLLRT